jgi:uncharacterized surface protein with fasciclin (FAS1) repeats
MSTILEIAGANKSLTSLMKGVKAAGLEEVLGGHGPFTIFAPINMAFSKLTAHSFEELVKPVNKEELLAIMSFHVIPGKNLATDLSNGQKLKTVNGQELSVTVSNGEVRINGSKVLAQNMQGSNGVVHSIDTVNIPVLPQLIPAT